MQSSGKAIAQTYPFHELAMKALLIGLLLLSTLLSTIPQAFADHPQDRWGDDGRNDRHDDWRDERRDDWRDERSGNGRSEWRLGDHNQIYLRTNRGWQRVQGSATDVGDGWVIGTDRRNGGYGIYRWNGRRFDRMPGGAVQIGGSYERPWVVNNRGERFEWTGRDWREVGSGRSNHDNRFDNDRGDRRRSGW